MLSNKHQLRSSRANHLHRQLSSTSTNHQSTMSSDENNNHSSSTKYVRITKCKNYHEWRERSLAIAKKAGFEHHLLTNIPTSKPDDINITEEAAWAEKDEVKKQILLRDVRNQRKEIKLNLRVEKCCLHT